MSKYQQQTQSSILNPESVIYVAGHRGMVGAAIVRRLQEEGYGKIVTRTHAELDLTDQQAVRAFFRKEKIDYVVLAAAKVGGIYANNTYPAEFIYQNMMIEANVIHEAFQCGIERLLFLGSSCIYPKFAPQPMVENCLLTGRLEPTNEPYAIAKIAGIKLCEAYNRQYNTKFRSLMPTNLYGPGDNFDLENSHVIPALIRKFHEAKVNGAATVEIWGTGLPKREFLHVDDLASASLFVMRLPDNVYTSQKRMTASPLKKEKTDRILNVAQQSKERIDVVDNSPQSEMISYLNIGTGHDLTIADTAEIIKEVIGFRGGVVFNHDKPDGTLRKLLDISRISSLGWKPSIGLREGLMQTYNWFIQHSCNPQ